MKKYRKEADLQADILIYLEAFDFVADNIMVASKSGTPDIIACIHGRYCGIEVKLNYNKPSDLQVRRLGQIIRAGGYGIIAKSLDDVRKLINKVRLDQHIYDFIPEFED